MNIKEIMIKNYINYINIHVKLLYTIFYEMNY